MKEGTMVPKTQASAKSDCRPFANVFVTPSRFFARCLHLQHLFLQNSPFSYFALILIVPPKKKGRSLSARPGNLENLLFSLLLG